MVMDVNQICCDHFNIYMYIKSLNNESETNINKNLNFKMMFLKCSITTMEKGLFNTQCQRPDS